MPDIALWPWCDHACTMCSNPPEFKFTTKFYTFSAIKEKIDKYLAWDDTIFFRFPEDKYTWTITWWEPTLNPEYFKILSYIKEKIPEARLVQLTHWDRFADEEFTKQISTLDNYHIVIPLHWYDQKTHEEITKKEWSWELVNKWINNILKYKKYNNQTLELRIIIQWQNHKHLDKIYEYIHKNFSGIDFISSIMMEYEGWAIKNLELTRVTYSDVMKYNLEVFEKWWEIFWENKFRLYHFPLCTLTNKNLWKYTWRTLPAHEITFTWKCSICKLAKYCMWIHEAYCKFNGENEIKPFKKKDIEDIRIISDKQNFKYHPIKEVVKHIPWKKTVIFVGYACNNFCRFCIDLNKRHINRTTEQVLIDIYHAKKNWSDILEIIWWEVTIRDDVFTIFKFIKSLNFKHVYLVTNWNKFADIDFAKKLYNMHVLDSIVFSIHWHNAQLHDKLTRTSGSFEKLVQWIKNWISLWFDPKKIWTNTAIEKWNYKYLLEIWKLIKKLNCLWSSEFIFWDPNEWWIHDNFDKLMPRISEAAPYMRELLKWWNVNWMVFRVRYVPLCYFQDFIKTNNISELQEVKIYSKVVHSAPDFKNEDVIEWRKNVGRIKPEKCKWCKLYDICEWIWTTYYKRLWDDELLPIK